MSAETIPMTASTPGVIALLIAAVALTALFTLFVAAAFCVAKVSDMQVRDGDEIDRADVHADPDNLGRS
jgi:hypothetical protein